MLVPSSIGEQSLSERELEASAALLMLRPSALRQARLDEREVEAGATLATLCPSAVGEHTPGANSQADGPTPSNTAATDVRDTDQCVRLTWMAPEICMSPSAADFGIISHRPLIWQPPFVLPDRT